MPRSDDKDEDAGRPTAARPAPVGPPPNAQTSGTVGRAAVPPAEEPPEFESFDEVYEAFETFVYVAAARKLDGDTAGAWDVSQVVWVRFHRRSKVDGIPERVPSVLLGLVEGEVRNYLRGRRRQRIAGEADERAPSSGRHDPGALVGPAADVRYILSQMEPYAAELLQLDHIDGLPLKGIAAIVGRSVGTVSKDLCRARERFKQLYLRLRSNT